MGLNATFALLVLVSGALLLTACGRQAPPTSELEAQSAPMTLAPLGLLSPGGIERVSVASDGTQGNASSTTHSISADGRYVAFQSQASNLVPHDTNDTWDVFVFDRDTNRIQRVSVASDGTQGDSLSRRPSISADGRYVAFRSAATNLVEGDTNGREDVFVHDRATGTTERVSVSSGGEQANDHSIEPSISATGRYVAFMSYASNLVDDDTNGVEDVFVHDRETGQTMRVSVASDGTQASAPSGRPSISPDGLFVAFDSIAYDLVPNDVNSAQDVFVHDLLAGTTELVSLSSDGVRGNAFSVWPSIGQDGRYVAFYSNATNLVPGDTNGLVDVFVRDRATGTTERVSVSSSGAQADGTSQAPTISPDGRFVVFESRATNLVPGDTNLQPDVFVFDHEARQVERVSVASDGAQVHATSWDGRISADGRFVAFQSLASTLVPGDTNDTFDVFVHRRGPRDTTPPVVEAFVHGELGLAGWYTGDVSVLWTVGEVGSRITATEGCEEARVTSDTAGVTFTCVATSAGGTTSESVTIKRDATGPHVSIRLAGTPGAGKWFVSPVELTFDGEDAGAPGTHSGWAGCDLGPLTLGTDGEDQEVSVTCSDVAGNTTTVTRRVSIDTTPPTVTLVGVGDGDVYPAGSHPEPYCQTTDGLSGVAAPARLVVTGPSSGVGSFTVTCRGALDAAGNPGEEVSAAYDVHYVFDGFFGPVQMGVLNSVQANRAIPLRFRIEGGYGLAALYGAPTVRQIACDSGEPVSEVSDHEASAAGQSGYQYDRVTGEYQYNWKTDRSYAGSCRQLTFHLIDGTSYSANFQFR